MSIVKLVGVGPGHPGLATLQAVDAIKDADVIRHCDGCGAGLLHFAIAKADIGPMESVDEIVRLAREGKRVTVLFPGNPYAFTNGSAVAEKLERADVDFEAVPGLIVELAAPVMSGIPLTIEGKSASIGFGLVKSGETVVLRLASGWWESGISALLDAGRKPETPSALILNP
ncbi:MAG: SAM-dependent methyltransferase, partial [Candidatus Dormiibacterota bacterium]